MLTDALERRTYAKIKCLFFNRNKASPICRRISATALKSLDVIPKGERKLSTHPNAILLLVLTPDDLARKTYRAILAERDPPPAYEDDDSIKIGIDGYRSIVMESDYDEDNQISAPEGSIIVFDLFTYGYGEAKEWDKLAAQKDELEIWAKDICERHHCSYKIYVTANYW